MPEYRRIVLKLLALLLHYPDDELAGSLNEIEEEIERFSSLPGKDILTGFFTYLKGKPLARVQEEYIVTFDMNTAMSLNLTYHLVGDDKKRGAALAKLQQIYRGMDCELLSGELPDYLPIMLEFWSICPAEIFKEMAVEYREPIAILAAGLQEAQSPYAGLLRLTGELLDAQIDDHALNSRQPP